MPVFRQQEIALTKYYGWPSYRGSEILIPRALPADPAASDAVEGEPQKQKKHGPHLRSTQEVLSFHIQVHDGELEHVEDFIVDDETWSICYWVVGTRNWWPGKKVLVAPARIQRKGCIGWDGRSSWLAVAIGLVVGVLFLFAFVKIMEFLW